MSVEQETATWTTFDAVKGMLAEIMVERDKIPASEPTLHAALKQLAEQEEYEPFIGNYLFEERGHFPFCRRFQADLSNMELAGLLSSLNPRFADYTFQPKLRKVYEKYTRPRFSKPELTTIKNMSRAFLSAIDSSGEVD